MVTLTKPLHGVCALLDRVRVPVIRLTGGAGKVLVRRRDLRVAVFGCTAVGLALLGTVFFPLWLLALGPVVLGTPHVLSDIRYLVVTPGYHRRARFWLPVGVPLLAAGCGFFPVECGLVAVAAAAALSRADGFRKGAVMLAALAGAGLAWHMGPLSQMIMAHLHNFVALAIWWFWRPRTGWLAAAIPVLFLGGALLLTLGWIRPLDGAWSRFPGGLDLASHAAALAPNLPQDWALKLVVLFAFAQSVHYGIWLRLVPEDARVRETPRPFTATLRAMQADVGPVVFGVAVVIAIGVGVWAVVDLAAARIGYFRMALFHGYLELVAGALLFLEGRPAGRAPGAS